MTPSTDIGVEQHGPVAVLELRRPPHNFVDTALIRSLADALERLDADPSVRVVVLAAQGSAFCAGGNFGGQNPGAAVADPGAPGGLYSEALRLFRANKPLIAAVQGPAIGGGLGLALVADFRIACPQARFSANFTRLGIHPGFGLSLTLPRLVGQQQAARLLYTGARLGAEEALAIGLVDQCVASQHLREVALALASEIAVSAPLAVVSTRATLRAGLHEALAAVVVHEASQQRPLFKTRDFIEGVSAMGERRAPLFQGC